MDKPTQDLLKKRSNYPYPDYKDQVNIIRESLGLTQEQLAKMVDRTPRSIRTLENGEAFPRISTLKKIAEALHADLTISLTPKTQTDIPGIPGKQAEQNIDDPGPAEAEDPEFSLDDEKGFIIGETD